MPRLVVNLVGPPAAGKSTIAARYAKQPEVTHLDVDDFRREAPTEHSTWYQIGRAVRAAGPVCVVESSGLSKRLGPYVLEPAAQRRTVVTVVVTAPRSWILARLAVLDKAPTAPYGWSRGLVSLVDACNERLPGLYPTAPVIDSSDDDDLNCTYRRFLKVIEMELDAHGGVN